MRRGLLAVAGAAVVCGLCYLALRGFAGTGDTLREIVLLTCAATLTLAALAAAFAAGALVRANTANMRFEQLARSVDAVMRDLSARSDRESATIEELNTLVSRELELFSSQTPVRQKQTPDAAPSRDNIVSLPASTARRSRIEIAEAPALASGPEQAGFELAVQRALAAGQPDISLQPIVSISQGAATGFEVFAHVDRDDGMGVDLRRLPSSLPGVSEAAFERWLVVGAVEAARRQFGSGDGLPLHVPISEALLSESDELDRVLSTLGEHRDAAAGIVLSVPAVLIERHARYAEAVETLAGTGVRLAAEGWSGNKDGLEKMKRSGIVLLKLSADRLLGRTKLAKATTTAIRLVEIASALDVPVVAVNVANDEDAVSLIDLGVTLMTGNRFSGPRRLKPQDGARLEKIANLQGHTG